MASAANETGLNSSDPYERLKAARALQLDATAGDLEAIHGALRKEDDAWVLRALNSALDLATSGPPPETGTREDDLVDPERSEIYRQALDEVTGNLTHELRKGIGYARLAAETDVPGYDESLTRRRLDDLAALVDAIHRLGESTKLGRLREFDLADWIKRVASEQAARHDHPIEFAGPSYLVAFADPDALRIVVTNAVQNAAEAVETVVDGAAPPILVAYGDTDKDYWVSILDRGPGPPPGRRNAFGRLVTNKPGTDHRGIGLALAKNVIDALGGTIDLTPRERGAGAELRFDWPKPDGES